MRLNNPMGMIFWILLFEIIVFLLGSQTQASLYPWYENLNKSSLTPPAFVFPIVWSLLYALLAVVAWILSTQHRESSKTIITFYTIQILMNWAWTPLFFRLHWLGFSAIWIVTLTCLNVILIMKAKKTQTMIALLLLPYVLWLLFASYLNVYIALMN